MTLQPAIALPIFFRWRGIASARWNEEAPLCWLVVGFHTATSACCQIPAKHAATRNQLSAKPFTLQSAICMSSPLPAGELIASGSAPQVGWCRVGGWLPLPWIRNEWHAARRAVAVNGCGFWLLISKAKQREDLFPKSSHYTS